jgi:acyl carrier protein
MFEKIKSLIAEQLFIDGKEIKEESKFIDDLGADSLDVVQLLIAMEKEFNIKFTDEEIAGIKSVGDAVKLISAKKE